jgi:hypothetical protein
LFIVAIAATKWLRNRLRNNDGLKAWYARVLKDRLDLLKKIVIYGTLVLWIGIWLATRGDEKDSIGVLLHDISNAWKKQEIIPASPTAE